jgi:drug/metabolite transporter (DMT)-like permease
VSGVPRKRSTATLPVSVVLAVVVVFAGIVYPVTGSALRYTTPAVIATIRALASAALLLALLPALGGRLPRSRRLWVWAAAIGFGNTTLTLLGISEGTAQAGAAVASVLLNSSPFFVALLARVALDERINTLRAAGLVIGFGGVLVVVLSDPGSVASGWGLALGFALSLLGALGWACAGLAMRALTLRGVSFELYGFTAAQFLCGGVVLLPTCFLVGDPTATSWSSATMWLALGYLVVGGQVVVYVGFNAALGRWPSSRVYAATFLVPVVAVGVEAARGHLPGAAATVGMGIVILGVAIVNHPRAEAVRTSQSAIP